MDIGNVLSTNTSLYTNFQFAMSGKANSTTFANVIREASKSQTQSKEEYVEHLKEKYGAIRIESVGKDQRSLDKIAGTMHGGDVIISPIALDKMAEDPEYGQEIEKTIDHVFDSIPQYTAEAASMGLTFESLGVIVHDDGTVTHICGGGDTPERVAEVEEEHRKKRAKEAAQRQYYYDLAQDVAEERRKIFNLMYVQGNISLNNQAVLSDIQL